MEGSFSHTPVLLEETLAALALRPEGVYLDGTVGGAGHAREIAARLSGGRLIGLDKDPDAVAIASQRLRGLPAVVLHSDFAAAPQALSSLGVSQVDGILLDLGVSSHQLDTPERGFSYQHDAPLDMRMGQSGPGAYELVNTAPPAELARILREYGEERFASRIAAAIAARREKAPIATTLELAELVKAAIPAATRREGGHPAKRSFQALRIAVNGELDSLREGLEAGFGLLAPGGRFVILTFHSLEDRLVKRQFAQWAKGCICPPDAPICVCGHKPSGRVVGKSVTASQRELDENNRSRSARLRAFEKY